MFVPCFKLSESSTLSKINLLFFLNFTWMEIDYLCPQLRHAFLHLFNKVFVGVLHMHFTQSHSTTFRFQVLSKSSKLKQVKSSGRCQMLHQKPRKIKFKYVLSFQCVVDRFASLQAAVVFLCHFFKFLVQKRLNRLGKNFELSLKKGRSFWSLHFQKYSFKNSNKKIWVY